MGRVIHKHIKQPLADFMLFGELKDGGTARLVVKPDEDGSDALHIEAIPAPPEPTSSDDEGGDDDGDGPDAPSDGPDADATEQAPKKTPITVH